MKKSQKMGGIAVLALVALGLAGCALNAPTDNQSQPKVTVDTSKTYIASGHPEWSPIMWQEEKKIVGAGPDLVAKIAGDLGLKVDSIYTGFWDEVQEKAKSGQADMLVAAYKTAERETYMDYSVPYTTDPIAIFVSIGKQFPYDKWDDLIGKKGVATVGDSYGQDFDNFIQNKLTVERVNTADQAFAALKSGKADYFLYALYSGENALKQNKTASQFEALPKYVAEENFYITISKKSLLVQIMPQVNDLIAKYKNDGTINELIKANKAKSIGE